MNIICFLTVKPCAMFYEFVKQLNNDIYSVYICIDDNSYSIPGYDGIIPIIQLDNKLCEKAGYHSTVAWLQNKACSRDKALYYFSKIHTNYKNIWFIEEDVFIPTLHSISYIDEKNKEGDLLCAFNLMNTTGETKSWIHWRYAEKMPLPWCRSMICSIRVSRQMMTFIEKYAQTNNGLIMDEIFFTTLALHNNLTIVNPPELSTIDYRHNWNVTNVDSLNNLYHPIKKIQTQYNIRRYLLANKLL